MKIKPKLVVAIIAAGLAIAPFPALAVDSTPAVPMNPDHAAGSRAIEARDWNAAIQSLSAAERRDSRNADVQNLLGYAYRNAGNLDLAFKHYQRALQLDPRHLGAHEYIGEAYLMANNLAKAEEHFARLTNLCPRVCEERDDLGKKIAEYRARGR
jgi:tetratricopeptide (TPR) repeat protein